MAKMTARFVTFAMVCALVTGGALTTAWAAPSNDNLVDANAIDFGNADTGPILGASEEAGEPTTKAGVPVVGSVWEKWTPSATATAVVTMCNPANTSNPSFDPVIEVYSGPSAGPTFAGLTSVASNDDGCGGTSKMPKVKFTGTVGNTYYIAVDQKVAGSTYEVEINHVPGNDDFSGFVLTGSPVFTTGTNVDATKETGEPNHAGSVGGASVWWSWTAPTTDNFVVQTCGSSFDTLLAVYTGGAFAGGLTPVVSDDNSCGVNQSKLVLAATAGTTYRIAVDGKPLNGFGNLADTGNIQLAIAPPPGNDNLSQAIALTGFPVTTTGSTISATAEGSENAHGGLPAVNSIWYRWTAPSTGPVTVDTCGSNPDTTLGVYNDGTSFPLTEVASNADSCGSQSSVNFNATNGTAYRIAIDGVQGVVQLNIHDVTGPTTTLTSSVVRSRRHKATFTFTATDDRGGTVTFLCSLDNTMFSACTSPVILKKLRFGKHSFAVESVDGAGNIGTAVTKNFKIRRPPR